MSEFYIIQKKIFMILNLLPINLKIFIREHDVKYRINKYCEQLVLKFI